MKVLMYFRYLSFQPKSPSRGRPLAQINCVNLKAFADIFVLDLLLSGTSVGYTFLS